jgi:plastocyanin
MGTATERDQGGGAARRAARHRQRAQAKKRRIALVCGALTAVALVFVIVVAAATGGSDSSAPPPAPTLDLSLGDYFIAGDLEVAAGPLRVRATNVGAEPHDVGIRGPSLRMPAITTTLFRGQSADLDVALEPGTYELFCDISDHVARGMVATLTVTEAPVVASSAP